jgi:hypothetical protein
MGGKRTLVAERYERLAKEFDIHRPNGFRPAAIADPAETAAP